MSGLRAPQKRETKPKRRYIFIGIKDCKKQRTTITILLTFAVILMAAFIVNYKVPPAWHENRRKRSLYMLGEVDLPMLRLQRFPLLVGALLGCLCIMCVFAGSMTTAHGAESTLVPSYGSGPYQMLIFSDYFCQPCQRLEHWLDKQVQELLANGGVKVSFVDLPIYKLTPLYARYFLYAINASQSYKDVLIARRVLFDTASRIGAITEPQLENALKARNVPLKPYDVKPVFKQYNDIARKYQVRGTPNIVLVYSSTDIRKYSGDKEILKGLTELRTALGHP